MRGTRLYIDLGAMRLDDIDELLAADGFVIGPGVTESPPPETAHDWTIAGVTPLDCPVWAERRAHWVCDDSLERTAQLRDGWPDLAWIPRAEVYMPAIRYEFCAARLGEGFSVYRPDTSSIQKHRVVGDESELHDWLTRAGTLGFRLVWLHSRDAADHGRGLDLELLDRARRLFAGGKIWLSGGASEPQHLANMTVEGGTTATIVSRALASRYGCDSLLAALGRPKPVAAAMPRHEPGKTGADTSIS